MFFTADIDANILLPGIFTYHLAFVNLLSRFNKNCAPFLSINKPISFGNTVFMGNQRPACSRVSVCTLGPEFKKQGINYSQSLSICNEFTSVPKKLSCCNYKFKKADAFLCFHISN